MSSLPIPISPSELTASWMNAALQSEASETYGQVQEVKVEQIGEGIGLMGGLFRCSLTFASDDDVGPATVVVKLRSEDPKSIKVAKMFQLYEKEVVFYREIAPTAPISVPMVYYGDFDVKTQAFVLVLEDLSHLEIRSQLEGGTEEQGRLAVRQAARLHARFLGRDREAPLKSYFSTVAPLYMLKIHVGFHNSVDRVIDTFDSTLSLETKKLIRAFGDNLAGYYQEIAQTPKTLCHGDYRLDNMFFGEPGTGDLVVIDWQTNGIALGMVDVAYFMAGSVESSVRKLIEREAIAEYHEITCREGGADWDESECWRTYRESFVAAMTVPVIAAGELSLENDDAYELMRTGLERLDTAILELDVEEFAPQKRSVFTMQGMMSAISNQVSRVAPTPE